MELRTAIRDRRSIRAFKSDPVPETVVRELLEDSVWAPSWANTQSTFLFVVSGAPLDAIKDALRRHTASNALRSFDLSAPKQEWPPYLAARTKRLLAARADKVSTEGDERTVWVK